METTTIQIDKEAKVSLEKLREYPRETYNHIIKKLINLMKIMKRQPTLTKQTLLDIEDSRKQFERGEFYGLDEVESRLGLR